MQVLDLTILGEQIGNVLFGSFFMDVGGNDDPSLDTADGDGILGCQGFGIGSGGAVVGGGLARGVVVDFHCGRHDKGLP